MGTSVAKTSIEAYQTLKCEDEQTVTISTVILQRTNDGKSSWIRQLARDLNMDVSSVSARLNKLKKEGVVVILSGMPYKLVQIGFDRDPITKKKAEAWQLVHANSGKQLNLFN